MVSYCSRKFVNVTGYSKHDMANIFSLFIIIRIFDFEFRHLDIFLGELNFFVNIANFGPIKTGSY